MTPAAPVLRDQSGGRLQEPGPVARGVGAQAGLVARASAELEQLGLVASGRVGTRGQGRQNGGHELSVKHGKKTGPRSG